MVYTRTNQFKPIDLVIPTMALISGIMARVYANINIPVIIFIFLFLLSFKKFSKLTTVIIICALAFSSGSILINKKLSYLDNFLKSLPSEITDVQATVKAITTTKIGKKIKLLINHDTKFCVIVIARNNNALPNIDDVINIKSLKLKKIFFAGSKNKNDPYKKFYLLRDGAIATVFVKNLEYKLVTHPQVSVERDLYKLRSNIFESIKNKLSQKTLTLFSYIFLGNKETESEKIREQFNLWGLAHYLARAGLHVAIFIAIWSWLLSFIPLYFILKQLLLIIICSTYAMLSWPTLSFMRAFILFILFSLSRIFSIQASFLYLLNCLCFVILIFHPEQIFFLDFQLTFLVTFALAIR